MEEFEIVEDVIEAAEDAEAAAGEMAMGEAAAVEEMPAVEEMAEMPEIEAEAGPGALDKFKNFINNNPYGQKLWSFCKLCATSTVTASVMFGVTYALNKAIAQKAKETGNRTALSEYLTAVQNNFTNKLHLNWTEDLRQKAAEAALVFPWIDATQ